MVEIEPEPEPEDIPSSDEINSVAAASAESVSNAIKNNPALTPDKIKEIMNEVAETGAFKEGSAVENAFADVCIKAREAIIDISGRGLQLKKVVGAPPDDPFSLKNESNQDGKANADILRGKFKKLVNDLDLETDSDGTPKDTPANQGKISKAMDYLKSAFDKEESPIKNQMLKALLVIVPQLISAWVFWMKINAMKGVLDGLAKGMDECDEVNFTNHTQVTLVCGDSSRDVVKNACACPDSAASTLSTLCTTFNPANTCAAGYNYIYFEYHWYNVLPALAANVAKVPGSILDFFKNNKWTILSIIGIFFLLVLVYFLIKHYI